MTHRFGFLWVLGMLAAGCGAPSIVPSTGDDAPATAVEPGPDRYVISDGTRTLGVAELPEGGQPTFVVAAELPSPCLADALAADWKAFEWPETVMVDASYYDPEEKTHYNAAASFDRSSDDYPLAILDAFFGAKYEVKPSLPIDRHGERKGPVVLPATFEVTASRPRGERPDNFTHLPLGAFTVNSDHTISLATACEGEYIAARLAKHFAQDDVVLSFSQPGGRWNLLAERTPGDLRLTGEENADVRIRYQRDEPEFFAALMTVVDRAFYVGLDVEPAPSLSVSFP